MSGFGYGPKFGARRDGGFLRPSGIQLVGSVIQHETSSISLTGLTGGIGSQPQEGDLVLGTHALGDGSNLNVATSTSGYTQLYEQYEPDAVAINVATFGKFMGATPDTELDFVDQGLGKMSSALVFRGVDPAIVDVPSVGAQNNNSGIVDPPPITPGTDGAVIVAVGAVCQGNGITMTQGGEFSTFVVGWDGAGSYDTMLGIGVLDWDGAGEFNASSWGNPNSGTLAAWASHVLALRPAA